MTTERQIAYISRCIEYLDTLIGCALDVRFPTPAQRTQEVRWRHARRALHHDLKALEMLLPAGQMRLPFLPDEDVIAAQNWYKAQFGTYHRAKDNDPLNKGAENGQRLAAGG